MADRMGQLIGDYKLIRFLGEGNLGGDIYLAEQKQTKNHVAIKIFEGRNDGGGYYHGKDFLQQAQRLLTFKHRNILQVLDYSILDNQVGYIVIEYITNNPSPLLEHYPRGAILEIKTIVFFVKQIAAALQYFQDHPFLDSFESREYILCPQNMWLSSNSEILLGGFEDALLTDIRLGRQITINQLRYMAPEFYSRKSSQYSLATIAYEWLCGVLPFTDALIEDGRDSWRRVTPPSLHEQNPAISHEVETVVMKTLSKDPEKRYETILGFAEALEEAVTSDTDKTDKYRMPDRSGEQFGKYRLVRLLGSGGFAEVYLGQHIKLNTFAAIKVLHTRLSTKELEAFEREAQTIANLRHPSIVHVLDYDAQGNIPFLVMEHAAEGTMRQFHARGSRLSLPLVVKYIKQIADALQYAHNQKIIHRDVKPANMLIMSKDTIMLSDFGLAVIAHSERSWRVQDKAGTALYMAPEQFRGKAVPASDQYSLAITAYEWLCGAPPFDEGNEIQLGYQHAHEPVPPMDKRGAVVSKDVEQVIMKALEKEPLKRFGSVKEFAEALEKAAAAG
jgi:serine/threonine protein kinase